MFKKIGTITLAGTLAFSLSACDEKEEVAKTVSNNTKEEQSSEKKKMRRKKIQGNIMLKKLLKLEIKN